MVSHIYWETKRLKLKNEEGIVDALRKNLKETEFLL